MDSSSFGGGKEGSVSHSVNFASGFANADAAQNIAFLRPYFRGVFPPEAIGAQFGSFLIRSYIAAHSAAMPLPHVFLLRKPLKIVSVVVGFISILVMDNLRGSWLFKPADGDQPMKEAVFTGFQVSIGSLLWRKWGEFASLLSKNFPAPRDSVFLAEDSILDSFVDICGQHCGSFGVGDSQAVVYLKT